VVGRRGRSPSQKEVYYRRPDAAEGGPGRVTETHSFGGGKKKRQEGGGGGVGRKKTSKESRKKGAQAHEQRSRNAFMKRSEIRTLPNEKRGGPKGGRAKDGNY